MNLATFREYPHVALASLVVVLVVVSILRRRRRPSNDELLRLGRSLLGTASTVFVVGWLMVHKNSELDGFALVLMAGVLPYGWTSLCLGYDTIVEMWQREVPPKPP